MQPIKFYNRYTKKIETEEVYGERPLRWIYETVPGKLSLHALVKRKIFSSWYGSRMDSTASCEKIEPFLETYKLDPNDFQKAPNEFTSFNDFFTRKLKDGKRPIDSDSKSVVFPADGRHLGFQNIDKVDRIFAKGQSWDLESLLQSKELANKYSSGALVLSRLCPVDYHRYHFPLSGKASESKRINGYLYSVSPFALRQNISIFWENERVITELETENAGTVLLLEIGATCVGKIVQTYQPNDTISKGDEKGYFAFGGSSTITIFEPDTVKLSEDLVDNTKNNLELYAKMGDVLGKTI